MAFSSLVASPVSNSVRRDAQAIEVVHPRHKKRAVTILPCSVLTASRRMSPQTGLLTSTDAVASVRLPALRGWRKWSSSSRENIKGDRKKGEAKGVEERKRAQFQNGTDLAPPAKNTGSTVCP